MIPMPVAADSRQLVADTAACQSAASSPGIRVIEHGSLLTGPDPSTFVFTKTDLQRNLFRIPLH